MGSTWNLTKLSGTGNSFLLADFTKKAVKLTDGRKVALAQRLCDQNFGIGADGLIFLYKGKRPRTYRWDFYNSDGSSAEMCGNAARCVARQLGLNTKSTPVILTTNAGDVALSSPKKDIFEVLMPFRLRQDSIRQISAEIGREMYVGEFVNTGVPHFCIQTAPDAFRALSSSAAKEIQLAKAFQPSETNVTYWTAKSKNKIQAVTFERGVRDFTLACGTGAVAAGLAFQKETESRNPVTVRMPGGELIVRIVDDSVFLSGPALKIADLKMEGKAWT